MKRLIATLPLLLMLLLPAGMQAQTAKVMERSAKSVPSWLSDTPKGYLVVETTAPDMSTAKDDAIRELATRIIMSVATNVDYSSYASGQTDSTDGRLSESESFGFDTRIAAAHLPFIKGISLTEAKDTYWEKCREKKTDRIFYRYAVLYPFPDSQLQKLRQEFEEIDNAKTSSLNSLREGLDQVSSSQQIEQAITELDQLHEYFFDNVRRKEAEGLKTNYKKLYKGLTLKATKPEKGKFTVTLLLQGRPFEVVGVPTLKSNCASRLQAVPLSDGYGYEITYDDIDCLPDEDNWIEINLRMRDTRVVQKVYL